jgi:dGTPase
MIADPRETLLSLPAFRRLAGKTQVLVAPRDGSLRTRLTHTLEVASMARRIARALGKDESLAEAIAMAHDIGHPAFGHAGEQALARLAPGGFHHAAHGVRVLTILAPADVFVASAVLDGVLKHSKGKSGPTFARGPALSTTSTEARIVRAADLYAYAWHDLEDAYALRLVAPSDLPPVSTAVLGSDPQHVRSTLVAHTIEASAGGDIGLPPETERALEVLRAHLYEHLYESPLLRAQTDRAHACMGGLFAAYVADEEAVLVRARRGPSPATDVERRAVDFLASLCDVEALALESEMLRSAA